jgi:hypothetical protein
MVSDKAEIKHTNEPYKKYLIICAVTWPGTAQMNNLIGLLRELRLMKDQSSHRYYAAWLLVLTVIVGGLFFRSTLMMELLSRFL